mmetsp:Transcript_19415/g.61771  ORF Transcript_19415/g.61771 Transcript_19415/m.61771 type:complete len:237 (-) Transcript_19415:950-1660(-)
MHVSARVSTGRGLNFLLQNTSMSRSYCAATPRSMALAMARGTCPGAQQAWRTICLSGSTVCTVSLTITGPGEQANWRYTVAGPAWTTSTCMLPPGNATLVPVTPTHSSTVRKETCGPRCGAPLPTVDPFPLPVSTSSLAGSAAGPTVRRGGAPFHPAFHWCSSSFPSPATSSRKGRCSTGRCATSAPFSGSSCGCARTTCSVYPCHTQRPESTGSTGTSQSGGNSHPSHRVPTAAA